MFLQDALGRALITLMDGSRDRAELYEEFRRRTGQEVSDEILDRNVDSLGDIPLFHE